MSSLCLPWTRVSREFFTPGLGHSRLPAGILLLVIVLGSSSCSLPGNAQPISAQPVSRTSSDSSRWQHTTHNSARSQVKQNITISISPTSAVLQSGATQLFTASLPNTSDTAVTWTATTGTISSQGEFTAPNVTSSSTVMVTATSVADSKKTASAIVTVDPVPVNLGIITTSIPAATIGTAYSAPVSVTGGQSPYKWGLSSGSLPSGIGLDSASGIISGATTQSGSFSFTVTVTDFVNASASQSLSMEVISQSSSPGQNGSYDGPAELPRIYLQTTVVDTPSPGATSTVDAGGNLQTALNAADCGDTVELQAGATFNGDYKLPAKACDDSHWITVRTSAPDASLPPEGTRITPCYAGVALLHGLSLNCGSATNVMAKLVGFPALQAESGSNHYRLIGLEVTQAPGHFAYSILNISDTSNHIVVDRCWVHGTASDNSQQGVRFNSSYLALVDSFVSDIHYVQADSQAVGGAAGTGPYKIVNNYLEAAGQNIMFGGSAATTTPSDIEIRRNHLYKPLTWWPGSPTYAGIKWTVKDLFEIKNARRMLLEGNIFENMWGTPIVITPKNQNSLCPICMASDITFRFNIVNHAATAFTIADVPSDTGALAQSSQYVSVHDDLFEDINRAEWNTGSSSWMFYFGACASCQPVHDVTMTHLTVISTNSSFLYLGNSPSNPVKNLVYTQNLQQNGLYGINGCGTTPVESLNTCAPGANFTGHVIVGGTASKFPGTNSYPPSWSSLDFGSDYLLLVGSAYVNGPPQPGADIATLRATTAGVSQW
jgi:hypothetical protein